MGCMDAIVESSQAKHETSLNEQLSKVREVLNINVDQLLTLISQRMRDLQKEAARQKESEAVELRREVERLQRQISAMGHDGVTQTSGGTGDTPQLGNGHKADLWAHPSTSAKQNGFKSPPDAPSAFVQEPCDNAPVLEISTPAVNGKYQFADSNPEEPKKQKPALKTQRTFFGLRAASQGDDSDNHSENSDHSHHLHIGDGLALPPKKKKGDNHKSVFADASAMKEKVRAAVAKKEYNVADYYYDTGCAQKIARSQHFEYVTLFVIAFNAIWIAIDADLNTAITLLDAEPVFQVAEHGFCVFFTFEWTVRFLSFRRKRNCARDAWFIFDSLLVTMMIAETWIMTLAIYFASGGGSSSGLGNTSVLKLVRLVRLTRMARMARLLRAVPELIILIKGIAVASRSVIFTLILLVIIIYFFAIVFRQLSDDTDLGEQYFRSVPAGMQNLLLDGVLPDQGGFVNDCSRQHFAFGILSLCFILLASMTIMNMLVGVLCEVINVVSSVEREQLTVNYVKMKLQMMFGEWDTDGSMTISQHEFEKLLVKNEAAKIIQEIGVDVVGLVDFADYIFKDGSELTFVDFMELVLSLRGTNTATVKDVVDMRKFFITQLNDVKNQVLLSIETMNGKMSSDLSRRMSQHTTAVRMSQSGGGMLTPAQQATLQAFAVSTVPENAIEDNNSDSGDEQQVAVVTGTVVQTSQSMDMPGQRLARLSQQQSSSENMVLPGQRPTSAIQRPSSGQRPRSGNGRPANNNNNVKQPNSRPGTATSRSPQRPQRPQSAFSSQSLDTTPPALPEFSQRLWIGEYSDDENESTKVVDEGRPVTRS